LSVKSNTPKKPTNWLKVSLYANVALVAVGAIALAATAVLHESDTNATFCATCHLMQDHVDSYLTSSNLDHVHAEAGVECKQCHFDYSVADEIVSGINYVTGNYEIRSATDARLPRRDFGNELCLKCHVSQLNVAMQTDYLEFNPHASHEEDLECSDCHISHGKQLDKCGGCHFDSDQRLIGSPFVPRVDNPYLTSSGIDTNAVPVDESIVTPQP
jgi:fumarate reductase flavoprotein subunit